MFSDHESGEAINSWALSDVSVNSWIQFRFFSDKYSYIFSQKSIITTVCRNIEATCGWLFHFQVFNALCYSRKHNTEHIRNSPPPQMNPKASFGIHGNLPNTMDGSLVQELGQLLKLLRDFKLTAHAMVDAAFQIRTAHRSLPPLLLGSLWIVGNRITLMFYFPSSLDSLYNK